MADSTATIVGSLLGTSTVTSYIESAAGVRAGGRTGLVGVVVAVLFLLSLFLSPLAADGAGLRHRAGAALRRLPDGPRPRRRSTGRTSPNTRPPW